ncbi:hypothetical protein HanXRQr2_Chr10g0449181 [Helianthus annuus]|uniref:Uncharacterized protein n=1 Tax=Helianthus annuus TaxID=4232 RepID=A0A9K3N534_HELAN|nr:hypothetical protein HanXRQr2_Chr10g0449181 [Helianthus annuus]KAJ0884431.1 hypothetical protein HanPSC8_Chr10g0433621 [Helianthus annuus]
MKVSLSVIQSLLQSSDLVFQGFCIFFIAPSGYLSVAIQEYEGHSRRLVKILPDP